MFTIPTTLDRSEIHGIGVFSCEKVKEGSVVWVFNPRFDLLFSVEEVESLPKVQRDLVRLYGYLDKQQFNGWYVLHVGNDRFTNHSNNPNTKPVKNADCQYVMIATKDIQAGEEITCDYSEYEDRTL
jgi:uncharacterized protein